MLRPFFLTAECNMQDRFVFGLIFFAHKNPAINTHDV
jgi:hypothetical protein